MNHEAHLLSVLPSLANRPPGKASNQLQGASVPLHGCSHHSHACPFLPNWSPDSPRARSCHLYSLSPSHPSGGWQGSLLPSQAWFSHGLRTCVYYSHRMLLHISFSQLWMTQRQGPHLTLLLLATSKWWSYDRSLTGGSLALFFIPSWTLPPCSLLSVRTDRPYVTDGKSRVNRQHYDIMHVWGSGRRGVIHGV